MFKAYYSSLVLVISVFFHAEAYSSSPPTVDCATCRTAFDFWVYGAGYIEKNHGGAFAAISKNDRIIVRNYRNERYIVVVAPVINTFCFIYCFSYDERGKWKVTYQKFGGGPAGSAETFLHVLRSDFNRLQVRENSRQTSFSLSREVEDSLHGSEAYASSMGPVFQSDNKYRWEMLFWRASIDGIYIGPPGLKNGQIPIVTQTWYGFDGSVIGTSVSTGTYMPTFDVLENY
jgi:hypothetical protein